MMSIGLSYPFHFVKSKVKNINGNMESNLGHITWCSKQLVNYTIDENGFCWRYVFIEVFFFNYFLEILNVSLDL